MMVLKGTAVAKPDGRGTHLKKLKQQRSKRQVPNLWCSDGDRVRETRTKETWVTDVE